MTYGGGTSELVLASSASCRDIGCMGGVTKPRDEVGDSASVDDEAQALGWCVVR